MICIFSIGFRKNHQEPSPATRSTKAGFSLFELMIVVAAMATILAIAVPMYMESVHTARIVKAAGDIQMMSAKIDIYRVTHSRYPATLADAGFGGRVDPWGNPYEYLRIEGLQDRGHVRKDKNLNPLNSDYDLYSVGKDGESEPPLTANGSHDDIIRANNGKYVGLAENY